MNCNQKLPGLMLKESTIAIYIILDDILKAIDHKEDVQRKVNDAMIMTTVLISARYFGGNLTTASGYIRSHHCVDLLEKSRFNRRMHSCSLVMETVFRILGYVFKSENKFNYFTLDTFPVAVCHNIRISRCNLLEFEDYRGRNASKRIYFYGFKIAVIATEEGIPVEIAFIPGSYAEQSALHRLPFDLPVGSTVFGDSGFTDYEFEDFMDQEEHIKMMIARKKGSLRGDDFPTYITKKYFRRRIETTFSEITAQFHKKIHAVTIEGFQYKIFAFIVAFAICKFFEF